MTNAFGEGPRDVDWGPAGPEGQAPECRAAPTLAPSTSNLIEAGRAFETLRSIGDETGIGAELQGRPAGRSERAAPLRKGDRHSGPTPRSALGIN